MRSACHLLKGKRMQSWLGDKHYPAVEINQLAILQASKLLQAKDKPQSKFRCLVLFAAPIG